MHSFAAATCMDVFSYGMVCFWILFKGFLFHDLPVKEELKSLKILKDEVRLVEVACKSVDSLEIDEDHRLQLRAFFDSTLATDPSQRRQYASPEMPLLPHDFVDLYDIDLFPDDADGHLTFHLADSLRQLSMVDFRVREGIFKALESNFSSACQTCTSSTVVQLSLCLHLGFGVGRDVKKRDLLLSDSALSQREFEVELNRVEHLKLERSMVTLLELADDDFLHEYQSRGDMVEAVSHYEREIAARQQVFPGTHLLVTVLKCILAHIYEAVGRRDEGTALFKAIYDAHLTEFGPDDAETLLAKVNLLNSYNETGKSSLALSEGEKLVPICQKVFGDDDPWATTCMANLAMSYYHQEQYELAIRVLKEATALFEKVLGQEHLYTMAAMGNLALVYMDKNPQEAEEALAVMMEVVRRRLQSTGQSHRHSISSEAALALALKRTGTDLTEVASIQRRIVEETQSLHTAGGPDVWIAKINYALTLGDLGDWEKAKPLFEESLLKLGLILGSTHPLYLRALRESGRRYEKNKDDVGAVSLWQRALGLASEGSEIFIDTAHDLAVKYYELEEYESASELWTQIIEVGRQRDGPIHPNVLAAMSWLGSHFIENGQFVKGQSLLFECYQGYEATHGDYHVETLKARHEIGRSYILTSQFANAEEVHTKLMEANQKALPASHDLIHTNMESLAEVYRRQNRYKQALRLDQEVILLRKSILGWENEDTINSMFFVARDLKETGDMALAEALCRETLELRRKTGGKMAPKSLIVERELLTILTAQKKFEEAEVLAKQHSEDCKGEYGSLHEESLEGLYWLAYTMSDIGKHSEAQLHAKEALDGCLKLLGPGNADTIAALGLLGVALRDDGQVDEAISKFELELSWSESLPEEERRFRSVRAMEHLISAYAIQGIGDKVKGLEERIAKMRPEPWPCTEVEDGLRKIVNLYLEAPAGDLGLHG
jgi:tetratricopeptide (TPR) repeat protein